MELIANEQSAAANRRRENKATTSEIAVGIVHARTRVVMSAETEENAAVVGRFVRARIREVPRSRRAVAQGGHFVREGTKAITELVLALHRSRDNYFAVVIRQIETVRTAHEGLSRSAIHRTFIGIAGRKNRRPSKHGHR